MDIQGMIKQKGYTQARVAELIGMNTGNFSVMIRGNITVENLRRIADAIGCKVTDFFADETAAIDAAQVDHVGAPGSGGIVCPHCGRSIQLTAQ